jgi:hypothetical protein
MIRYKFGKYQRKWEYIGYLWTVKKPRLGGRKLLLHISVEFEVPRNIFRFVERCLNETEKFV